jgi:type IX secretion system PorP/SprF family membrane protein
MKYLKIFILFLTLAFCSSKYSTGQQLPFYTQYMFNEYLINPAIAGTNNYYQIRANSRIQWVGMTDAPRTSSISAYGPLKDKSMGVGGYIYTDDTGPTSRLSANGTWAYNLDINDNMRIAGGISLGFMQYKLDGTEIFIGDEVADDPVFTGGVETSYLPDAGVGIYLYSTYYFVGLSSHQLLGSKLNLHNTIDSVSGDKGINRLKQHFYLSGGGHFILNKDLLLQPSVLIKGMFPSQLQAELNVKVTYQRMVWGGISYRTGDAVSVLLGYNYESKMLFGISYDITTSELRKYTSGTYEIFIGYKFNKIK